MNLYIELLASTIRMSVPLILACIAGLWSERSGIVDIGLEGKMLIAAFVAASASAVFGSAWIGLFCAVLASVAFALVHGYASINQRGNQVVSGVAINMLAAGLAVVLGNEWFKEGGRTPALPPEGRFLPFEFPMLYDIPVVGPFAKVFLTHSILAYFAFAVVPLSAWALARTRFGLRLRAVGENPQAVDTAGISVSWLRYRAVILCGILTGIAGTYISIAQNASFTRDMSAGQGFIALAALIFGKWRAWPAFGACLLFGLLDAVAIRLQGVRIAGIGEVPVQLIQALPYALTVILLAGFIGKAVAPKASGIPYVKEH